MKDLRNSLVLLLFLFSFAPTTDAQQALAEKEKQPIALEDIWLYYKFVPAFPEKFNWMKDDQYYSVLEGTKISKYGIKDRTNRALRTELMI